MLLWQLHTLVPIGFLISASGFPQNTNAMTKPDQMGGDFIASRHIIGSQRDVQTVIARYTDYWFV